MDELTDACTTPAWHPSAYQLEAAFGALLIRLGSPSIVELDEADLAAGRKLWKTFRQKIDGGMEIETSSMGS